MKKWACYEGRRGRLVLLWIFVSFFVQANCYIVPTNERTACRYNLKEKAVVGEASDESCEYFPVGWNTYNDLSKSTEVREGALNTANYLLIKCLEYRHKLKECNKEINYYIPTLHPE
ncbi:hypothetical protein EHQ61_08915 [Leptospira wolffii]|uniref:hypothetical protein n=1 Tax=Leptospira wolffii TaxID=409998 RepID=UPI001082352B|nr:hypothetical protein [Leptospira wolffii]TGL50531.1 hypothetical protein EHQ61_08915 [Leptospira wolffii]